MKERFNFSKDYKLYSACSCDDGLRPAMEMVHFIDGYAYASDSHILIKVPLSSCLALVDEDERKMLDGYSIHGKVLKLIYGFDTIHIERDDETGDCRILTKMEGHEISFKLQRTEEVHPPKFESVLANNNCAEAVEKIGINPKLLLRAAEAINIHLNAGLVFRGERNAFRIENKLDGGIAIIMPSRVD